MPDGCRALTYGSFATRIAHTPICTFHLLTRPDYDRTIAPFQRTPTRNTMTTKTITIQGLEFEVNQPYAEGHILTAAEAKALNQVRAENIRNNTARKIEAAKAEAGGDLTQQAITALAAEVAAYDAQYDFTLATGGGSPRVTDPVEREALSIARTLVRAQAKKEGRKILKDEVEPTSESDITKVRFLELVEGLAAREDVVKEARRRVKATEAIAA